MLLHLLDYGWLVPAYTVVGPGVHSFHIPVLGVTVHCKIELDPPVLSHICVREMSWKCSKL